MSRTVAFCASIVLLGTLAPSTTAGDLSNWRTIPLPAGASAFNSIGTTVSFQTATDVHLWSGISKRWTVVPITTGISFFEQYNAYVVFQDGNQIHAWSSREDIVDTITVSGSAVIKSGPVTSSWVTFAVDGTQAWGFSAFRGHWVPLTLSAPGPTLFATSLIGMIKDGTTVHAFSAHWGTFESVAADAAASPALQAETGLANSPGVFRGFSVEQNTWTVQAIGAVSSTVHRGAFALLVSGSTVYGFSGLSGTFTSYTATTSVGAIAADEACAAFTDGPDAVCYAAGPGAFATRASTSPTYSLDNDYVFVIEPTQVTPFSALTGLFGSTISGTYTFTKADDIAFADGSVTDYAYSPILNQWTPAPAVTPVASPALVRSAIVLPHTGGYEALSARYGTWVSQPTSVAGQFLAPSAHATIVAFDDIAPFNAFVFDSRLNRWQIVSGTNPLTFQIFRHTFMAHDSIHGFGFGQPTGRMDSVDLHGQPVTGFSTSSSSGYIATTTEFHAYSVQGSLSYEGRLPEFTRAINLGNVLRLHQTGPAGSALVMFIGAAPAHYDAGPIIGFFDIDPSFLIVSGLVQTIPASGLLHLDFPLPKSPVLVGVRPHIQMAVVPPGGVTPYLSSSVSPVLY